MSTNTKALIVALLIPLTVPTQGCSSNIRPDHYWEDSNRELGFCGKKELIEDIDWDGFPDAERQKLLSATWEKKEVVINGERRLLVSFDDHCLDEKVKDCTFNLINIFTPQDIFNKVNDYCHKIYFGEHDRVNREWVKKHPKEAKYPFGEPDEVIIVKPAYPFRDW